MICESCSFETSRLSVRGWHSIGAAAPPGQDLAAFVVGLMSESVTRSLPSHWRGEYTIDRAREWIAERDSEGTTLLILERSIGRPVGVVILSESASEDDSGAVDVRLGYLLAESAWDRGLGSELIEGLIGWCRGQPPIRSLAGGVESENVASARVLEKNGFRPVQTEHGDSTSERIFELRLSPAR